MTQNLANSGRFSTNMGIGSFAIGTLLFGIGMIDSSSFAVFIAGFFFVLLAIIANGLTFLNLLYLFIMNPNAREYLAIKMLILASNIPIAILYFYIITDHNLSGIENF